MLVPQGVQSSSPYTIVWGRRVSSSFQSYPWACTRDDCEALCFPVFFSTYFILVTFWSGVGIEKEGLLMNAGLLRGSRASTAFIPLRSAERSCELIAGVLGRKGKSRCRHICFAIFVDAVKARAREEDEAVPFMEKRNNILINEPLSGKETVL